MKILFLEIFFILSAITWLYFFPVEKKDGTMTVSRAESLCRQEGYRNWCRVDTRWGKVKVQCFNDEWKKKEVVIK